MYVNNAICITIEKWWHTWHRLAEEDEIPPAYILILINYIADKERKMFDPKSGKWENL